MKEIYEILGLNTRTSKVSDAAVAIKSLKELSAKNTEILKAQIAENNARIKALEAENASLNLVSNGNQKKEAAMIAKAKVNAFKFLAQNKHVDSVIVAHDGQVFEIKGKHNALSHCKKQGLKHFVVQRKELISSKSK